MHFDGGNAGHGIARHLDCRKPDHLVQSSVVVSWEPDRRWSLGMHSMHSMSEIFAARFCRSKCAVFEHSSKVS